VSNLIFGWNPWWLPLLVFVVLVLAIEVPYRWLRLPALGKNMDAFNALQAGLLTLASFVLGLSFSQASSRFDGRRGLVIKEANAIGTTWLRADQLSRPETTEFRRILTDYTAIRLKAYETPGSPALHKQALDRSDQYQTRLWAITSDALHRNPQNLGLSLLMQSLNDTIDVSAEQLQALTSHVPTTVIELTLLLVTIGALSLGLRFALDRARPAALSAAYVVANVVVISMMVDYDRPQTGFVKVNLTPIRVQLQSMQKTP
jgi:hypothetical protein